MTNADPVSLPSGAHRAIHFRLPSYLQYHAHRIHHIPASGYGQNRRRNGVGSEADDRAPRESCILNGDDVSVGWIYDPRMAGSFATSPQYHRRVLGACRGPKPGTDKGESVSSEHPCRRRAHSLPHALNAETEGGIPTADLIAEDSGPAEKG